MPWVWLAGAISLEVVATLNLKLSEGFTRFWPSVVVVLGYIGSFSLLGATLKRIDVGTVYAIWSGAGTVVVVFVGIMLFGESATGLRLLGIGVITVGVIVLNLSGGGHGGESAEAGAKPPPDEPKSEPDARHAMRTAEVTPTAPTAPRQRTGKHVAPPRMTTVRAFAPSPMGSTSTGRRRAAAVAAPAAVTDARAAARTEVQPAVQPAVTSETPTVPRGITAIPAIPTPRRSPESGSGARGTWVPNQRRPPDGRPAPSWRPKA